MIGEAGRARAEKVLDDTCTVRRAATDSDWTPGDPLPDGTTVVYEGPCALLGPRDRRQSDGGGDERLRTSRTLLVPVGAGPFVAADSVDIASMAAPYFVLEPEERSHRVLQRLAVASTFDAEGVPR